MRSLWSKAPIVIGFCRESPLKFSSFFLAPTSQNLCIFAGSLDTRRDHPREADAGKWSARDGCFYRSDASMPNTALSIEDRSDAPRRSLIDELNSAVATGGKEEHARILERVVDLFAAGSRGYSGDQIALFGDVLQRLAVDIEVKARTRLAGRLAHIGNAPHGLIRALAFDDAIEVAAPVLVHSTQLSDADLVENATTKSQDHLFAIAQRIKLSEAVTDVLVRRGDRRVVRKVVKNTTARASRSRAMASSRTERAPTGC